MKLFRPTIYRQDGSNSNNYLAEDNPQTFTYSLSNTNLESSSSFRYGDKPYLTSTQQLRLDWTKFENHTFFHSAVANVNEAFDKIINFYPFDQSLKEIEEFEDSLTGFEKHILDTFPKNKGYLNFDSTNFVTIKDKSGVNVQSISSNQSGLGVLDPNNNPFSIEFFIKVPDQVNDCQIIFQKRQHQRKYITLALSKSSDINNAELFFGTRNGWRRNLVSGSIPKGEWVHVSAYYAKNFPSFLEDPSDNGKLFLRINDTITKSDQASRNEFGIDTENSDILIGSGSQVVMGTDYNDFFTPVEVFTGSIDDLKFYHANHNPDFVKKNKTKTEFPSRYVNTISERPMKLYLKFNEPYGTYTGNSIVLDHSGFSLHGRISNFNISQRLTGSDNPMVSEDFERSPILFPEYSDLDTYNVQLLTTASLYDEYNPNIITKLIPEHYFQEATNFKDFNEEFTQLGQKFSTISNSNIGKNESEIPSMQLLIKMLLIYAKYFDEIKLLVDAITNFRYTEYNENETTPDVFLLEKAKLTNTVLPLILNYGNVDQVFKGNDLSAEKKLANKSLVDIQKEIWRRILSEAGKFGKRKGTPESIKSIFRNAGIEPDNILDFREYGGAKIKDLNASKETKKDVIYFLNFTGSIGKNATTFNAQGYPTDQNIPYLKSGFLSASRLEPGKPLIQGSFVNQDLYYPNGISDNISDGLFTSGSFTYEGLYSWPKGYQFFSESLARIHSTGSLSPASTEACLFNLIGSDEKLVLYFKESMTDPAIKSLVLTGANVFDKDIWNISFGKRDIHEIENSLSSSYFLRAAKQMNGDVLEFYQTSSFYRDSNDSLLKTAGLVHNASGSFIVIGSQSFQGTGNYLNDHSEALVTDFTGFLTNLRFFSKNTTEKEWLGRIKNYTTFGVENPLENYNYNTVDSGSYAKLRVHTDPKQKTKNSSASGDIRLFDFSKNGIHFSGSNFEQNVNVLKPLRVNYEVLSDKYDINYGKDKIRIRSFQDFKNRQVNYYSEFAPVNEIITKEESLDDNRLSLDMSVMKGLNRNMLNTMSSLGFFNDALGMPNLLFSEKYPDLENLRKLFFNNVNEPIDLKKYREIFKWIDSSFTDVVYSVIPRTTNFLGINFIYESHVLERHKFKYNSDQIYLLTNERSNIVPEETFDILSFGNLGGSSGDISFGGDNY